MHENPHTDRDAFGEHDYCHSAEHSGIRIQLIDLGAKVREKRGRTRWQTSTEAYRPRWERRCRNVDAMARWEIMGAKVNGQAEKNKTFAFIVLFSFTCRSIVSICEY